MPRLVAANLDGYAAKQEPDRAFPHLVKACAADLAEEAKRTSVCRFRLTEIAALDLQRFDMKVSLGT